MDLVVGTELRAQETRDGGRACVREMDAKTTITPTNGFIFNQHPDTLPFSSSHSLSPPPTAATTTTTAITTNHNKDFSIFPPINHEGLPVPVPPPPPPPPRAPHAPLSVDSYDQLTSLLPPPPPPPPPPDCNNAKITNTSQLVKMFNFALRFCNFSNLLSLLSRLSSPGLFSSFRPLAATVSFLVIVWFWLRLRRRRQKPITVGGDKIESVAHLTAIIKAKDEKIIQLLEQIAEMNKLLLARYRIPIIKGS